MDGLNLLPSRDFSYETLDFIDNFFQKNLSTGRENNFRELLFELFEGKGLNTKTKKSDLYATLENKLEEINYFIKDVPRNIVAAKLTLNALSGEEPSVEDNLIAERIAMLSGLIQGSLKIKVIARYEKLLPKRRSKDFKEKYPLLENAFKMYDLYNLNQEAEQKYMTIHNNNGISEQVQNLHLCKNEISQDKYGNINVKLQTSKGFIKLDVDTADGVNIFDVANKVNEMIGATQSQLIVYIMSLVFEQNNPEDVKKGCSVNIDVKEYCKVKGIGFEKKVGDAIYEDIKKLEKIIIEYEYINHKGKKDHLRESPLVMNSGILDSYSKDGKTLEKQVVGVALGKWIETLSYSQFQYISKAFFRYKLRNKTGAIIPISYHINCQHRNDYLNPNNKGCFKSKVINLSSKLGVEEDRIKSKGYSSTLKKPLENILNNIKDAEGFEWSYKNGTHNSRTDFEEDIIIFKNNSLDNLYREKGLTRKGNKKPKR